MPTTNYANLIDGEMFQMVLELGHKVQKLALYDPESSDLQKAFVDFCRGAGLLADSYAEKCMTA
tara:strand:+ start:2335 stop:2526 length:192 start_codon:yes stop_codon:yes gene_type:complete